MFGLRIDIDTIECLCHGVPNLLKILDKHQIKASFFCPMGWEGDLISVLQHRFLRSRKGFSREGVASSQGVRKSLSLKEVISISQKLIWPTRFLEHIDILQKVLSEGHDLGVHGYVHARWRCPTPSELKNEFRLMVDAYTNAFGVKPKGLAAPLFQNNDFMLTLCDQNDFSYVSALPGRKPFRPTIGGAKLNHLQIPVTIDPIHDGRMLPILFHGAKLGLTRKEMVRKAMEKIENLSIEETSVLTMHIHPKDEGIGLVEPFSELMGHIRTAGIVCKPFSEIATEKWD